MRCPSCFGRSRSSAKDDAMIATTANYRPNLPRGPIDLQLLTQSVPEPRFDAVLRDFLLGSHSDLMARLTAGPSLVEVVSLGREVPWLFRLTYHTRGLVKTAGGEVQPYEGHTIVL